MLEDWLGSLVVESDSDVTHPAPSESSEKTTIPCIFPLSASFPNNHTVECIVGEPYCNPRGYNHYDDCGMVFEIYATKVIHRCLGRTPAKAVVSDGNCVYPTRVRRLV